MGEVRFYFCRACKVPYDEFGVTVVNLNSLSSNFNPLKTARDAARGITQGASPVAQNAMEVLATQGYLEAYLAGMKDGLILAYSLDVKDGGPLGM